MSFSYRGTIFTKKLPNKKIDSAGTGALIGHEADQSAIYIAEQNGLSLADHKAKQFTASLGHQYDLILVMEKIHIEQICRIAPEVRGKTMLLGHWNNQKRYQTLIERVKKHFPQYIS